MRISDWSSDVCSSDLAVVEAKDNVGIHLNEPTIAVPGEALVARCGSKDLNRLIVKATIKDSVHHARHGHARAGKDGYKQRVGRTAAPLARDTLAMWASVLPFIITSLGIGYALSILACASIVCDR